MAVTLKDLAAMSGCSIRTVNRVIWRSGPVAEAKRLRIEALLREHHYVPNMAARNLKQSRRNFAGIIINGGTTVQIFLRKLSALVNRLGDQGFYPLLGHPVGDAVRLEQLLGEWTGLVQHVIFMYMPPAEILAHLPLSSHRFGMHFTVLDAMGDLPSEVSGLRIDRGAGIFEAISQLCAGGHRRILRLGNVSSRDDGWKAAREHFSGTVEFSHLPVQPECEVAAELGGRIFAGRPDAVFCDTDRAASGVLRAAAAEVFITDITQRAGVVAFTFDSRVDVPSLMAVCSMPGYRNRLRLSAGEPPRLRLHLAPGEDALSAAGKLTEELRLKKEELGKAAREGDNL